MTVADAAAVRTVIMGASGRMGLLLLRLLREFPSLQLHGAVVRPGSAAVGQDAGQRAGMAPVGVAMTDSLPSLLPETDLVLDFSVPAAAAATLAACQAAGVPLLIGTTDLSSAFTTSLVAASTAIPVLAAANTSLGVNLLIELVRQAARGLPVGYDIEIVETHHRTKRDAPSGTALALGDAAAAGRGSSLAQQAVYGRYGKSEPRRDGQIGFASVRGGDVAGDHEIWFLGAGERLLLKHSATDRTVFARGALAAGQWLARQSPGHYTMSDVFSSTDMRLHAKP